MEKKYNYQELKRASTDLLMENWELQENWYKKSKFGELLHNSDPQLYTLLKDKKNIEIIKKYKKNKKQ
jgi:hypothetical protein